MELKKWWYAKLGMWVPDYDSTKANFDALEKRIKDLETMEIGTSDRLTALEAKDAPRWRITGACLPITKQPPDTCGNCAKPARWDDSPDTVACDQETGCSALHHKSVQSKGCPHHERREA